MDRQIVATDDAALEVISSRTGPDVLVATHPSQYFGTDGGPLAPALASIGRAVIVNPRGTGGSSPWDANDRPIRQLVDDLDDVRKALHVERWIVVGQSLGGVVAMEYALRFPDSVLGLVLSCTTARGIADDPQSIHHPDHPDHALVREARAGSDLSALRALVAHRPELIDEASGGMSASRQQAATREIPELELPGRLPEIAAPTVVLAGRHDRAIPLHHSDELADLIPSAMLHVFEDSGHFPYHEEPELYRSRLAAFVASLKGNRG